MTDNNDDVPPAYESAVADPNSSGDNNNNNNNNVNINIDDIDYFIHGWIECQDTSSKWYEAQIVDIELKDVTTGNSITSNIASNVNRIKVHFKGWDSKWDEWIDLNDETSKQRIGKLHTNIGKPTQWGKYICSKCMQWINH